MSSTSGFRSRLILQAVITAVLAMSNGTSSGWTIPTLVVAAGAVFVGLAMRAEPAWRWYTVGYEGLAIAFGLVALVSGHYVPGTIIAGWTLYFLLSHAGAGAFAGTPTWAPPPAPAPAAWAPPAPPAPAAWAPPAPVPAFAAAAPVYGAPAAAAPVYGAPPAAGYAPPAPMAAAPVVPAIAEVPAQPISSRPVAMTILPGK